MEYQYNNKTKTLLITYKGGKKEEYKGELATKIYKQIVDEEML